MFRPPRKIEHSHPRKHSTTSTPSEIFLNVKASRPLPVISPAIYFSSSQPIECHDRSTSSPTILRYSASSLRLPTTFLITVIGRLRDKRIFLRLRLLKYLKVKPVHEHRPIMSRMMIRLQQHIAILHTRRIIIATRRSKRNFFLLTL